MHSAELSCNVDAYERHLFLCYKTHEDWPSHFENSDYFPVYKLLSEALEARKNDIIGKTRLTICESSEANSDGYILLIPEMVKYRGFKDTDVDGFVEVALVNAKPWASEMREPLSGSLIFVCAHKSRDKRCGVCGPALIDKFKEDIELRGLKGRVFVSACSHIGDHNYVGNVIIFSPDADGKITGHWYGYVTPSDVPELLDQNIEKDGIVERLWRGQMDELKLSYYTNGPSNSKKAPRQESIYDEWEENVVGGYCCQCAKGVSCCQSKNSPEEPKKKGLGMCSLSSWTGKGEQREVLTAAAVFGAVATVVVGYSFIKGHGEDMCSVCCSVSFASGCHIPLVFLVEV